MHRAALTLPAKSNDKAFEEAIREFSVATGLNQYQAAGVLKQLYDTCRSSPDLSVQGA